MFVVECRRSAEDWRCLIRVSPDYKPPPPSNSLVAISSHLSIHFWALLTGQKFCQIGLSVHDLEVIELHELDDVTRYYKRNASLNIWNLSPAQCVEELSILCYHAKLGLQRCQWQFYIWIGRRSFFPPNLGATNTCLGFEESSSFLNYNGIFRNTRIHFKSSTAIRNPIHATTEGAINKVVPSHHTPRPSTWSPRGSCMCEEYGGGFFFGWS